MNWKKTGENLLYPPAWLILFLAVISVPALVTVFLQGLEETIFGYIVYVLSFYTLVTAVFFFIKVLPRRWRQIKARVYGNPFGMRYMTDKAFRTEISLCVALSVSLLYVAANLWSWYFSGSWWFAVLAAYYVIMAIMRFLLVRYARKNEIGKSMLGEWKRSRICACILLLVNLSLSGAVLMILYQQRGYDYPGMLIYVMALYSFYSITYAIVDNVKYRALGSPVLSTAKIVSLSGALVSMLNLETAMFAQFGTEMARKDQNLMIILTGAGISVIVVAMSVILIVKATKEIRRENYGE